MEAEQSETDSKEYLTETKPLDKQECREYRKSPIAFKSQIRRLSEEKKTEKTSSLNRIQDWTNAEDDGKTIELDLTLEGRKFTEMLDTGSRISLTPEHKNETLADTDYILRKIYNGRQSVGFNLKPVEFKHTTKLDTKYQNTSQILKWWIIQRKVTPIIGIDNMNKVNIQAFHRKPQPINNVNTRNCNVEQPCANLVSKH